MIDGYQDIHANVRLWIERILRRADGAVYYDIGANSGELSLPFAQLTAAVVAFEPGAAAARRFEAAQSALPPAAARSVRLMRCALGSTRGELPLSIYSDDTFSSFYGRSNEECERYQLQVAETQRVPVWPLDQLIPAESLPPPTFLKIDVEGAELEVLRGASGTLTLHQPAILMEYSCINTRNAGYERTELTHTLQALGYRVAGLWRNEDPLLYAQIEDCRIWNLIAVTPRLAHLVHADERAEAPVCR